MRHKYVRTYVNNLLSNIEIKGSSFTNTPIHFLRINQHHFSISCSPTHKSTRGTFTTRKRWKGREKKVKNESYIYDLVNFSSNDSFCWNLIMQVRTYVRTYISSIRRDVIVFPLAHATVDDRARLGDGALEAHHDPLAWKTRPAGVCAVGQARTGREHSF